MHIVITGGAGFLGSRLAGSILASGSLALDGRPARRVERLTLIDRAAPPAHLTADPRVRVYQGDLRSLLAVPASTAEPDPSHGPHRPAGTTPTAGPHPVPGPYPARTTQPEPARVTAPGPAPATRPDPARTAAPEPARATGGGPAALAGADVVFHLAAAVSGECEADFDLGVEANLRASYALLQACRALAAPPVLVFASSLAVYGEWPGHPLPEVITDATLPTPRSSYGTQKFIVEQLVADYTRKGFLIGRPVRLMTVAVRPGPANAAASGFLSAIIREPLAGRRTVCPVPPDTPVALSSPGRTIAGLLRAAEVSTSDFGPPLAVNLPGLRTTVGEMVEALSAVAGEAAVRLIGWAPDPAVAAIVTGWPSRFDTARAYRLGLSPDPDVTSLVRAYLADREAGAASAGTR